MRVLEVKVALEMNRFQWIRFGMCCIGFVKQNRTSKPRLEIEKELDKPRALLDHISYSMSNFAICLPIAKGFFEKDPEITEYVQEGLRSMCRKRGVTWIPMVSILPFLNSWRKEQYHFKRDAMADSAPPLLWNTYYVNC